MGFQCGSPWLSLGAVAQASTLVRYVKVNYKMQDQRTQLDDLMTTSGLCLLAERVMALARPSIRFHLERVAPEETRLGTTRVGGDPDVPEGFDWPYALGVALPFVAQVNFGELAALDVLPELPSSGMLYFFFGEDAYFAAAESSATSWQVIYRQDVAALHRMPSPASVPLRERYHPCRVRVAAELTLPPLDPYDDDSLARLGLDEPLPDEQQAAHWEIQRTLAAHVLSEPSSSVNRLRGWADPVQWEVERDCLAETRAAGRMDDKAEADVAQANPWRLLLQIDTDAAPNTEWGDTGRIYFLIREADLMRHDVSNSWVVLQCT